ncbi:MAG: UDP-2,3-diacylglucosamine diphosphatase LpxI [Candidatus Rokubacteria bacterium]|nr:UDP-2,3-diacylglucosamine diphosphatase LpxI [Candidatus Rokubacteria bacterium]
MREPDGTVGLVAGTGVLPEVIARAVKGRGHALVCIQVSGDSPSLPSIADHYQRCRPGALADLLGALRAHRVRQVLVAGRFPRVDLLGAGDDLRNTVLTTLRDRRDVPLLQRLAGLLAELNMEMLDQTRFVGDLLAPPGVLTRRPPTAEEEADLTFGRTVARRIADLDIGQTVVLRAGVILAVEAAEGTDATIRRGGAMVADVVVVKASRNHQDPRFDIPTVGPDTIATMRDVSARVLGVDARRTVLLDRDRMIAEADAAGITIVAADAPPLGLPVHALA